MLQTITIRKDLSAKKVGILKVIPSAENEEPQIVKWLKPGDKLKTDQKPEYSYDDLMGDIKYQKVYYNGMEGWLVASTIER